jgi:hypothetical protein
MDFKITKFVFDGVQVLNCLIFIWNRFFIYFVHFPAFRLKSKAKIFGDSMYYLSGKRLGKAILNLVVQEFKLPFLIGPKRVPLTLWPDGGVDHGPENLCLNPYFKK